jgi:DNA-3-methyladenine glycosylase
MATHQCFKNSFFSSNTVKKARDVLGHTLVVHDDAGEHHFKIVETEAYTEDDPASHAHNKRQADGSIKAGRGVTMFGLPGYAYVYLTYGMYHCFNIVSEPDGTAGGILIRGVVALGASNPYAKYNLIGPGRLCRDLNISKAAHNGINLCDATSPLHLLKHKNKLDITVKATPRIGISKATDRLWRFIDTDYLKK